MAASPHVSQTSKDFAGRFSNAKRSSFAPPSAVATGGKLRNEPNLH